MPCQLQNRGRRATLASTCMVSMKLVVPHLMRCCRRGKGARGAITAARMRSSRSVAPDARGVVTKEDSTNRIVGRCGECRFEQALGWS